MAKLPTAEDLGSIAIPVSNRPVRGYDAGIVGRATERAIGTEQQGFKEAASGIETFADREQANNDAVATAAAGSDVLQATLNYHKDMQNDPDYNSWGQKYADLIKGVKDTALARISGPEAKARSAIAIDNTIANASSSIQDHAYKRGQDALAGWTLDNLEGLKGQAERNPYDDNAQRALFDNGIATLNAAGAKGAISQTEIAVKKREFQSDFAARVLRAQNPLFRQQSIGSAPKAPPVPGANYDNNLGNLKYSQASWEGAGDPGGPNNAFETFATPEQGVRAATINYRTQLDKLKSAGQDPSFINLANAVGPGSDNNDPAAYAGQLASSVGLKPGDNVPIDDKDKMATVMQTVAKLEKGAANVPADRLVYQHGVEAAFAAPSAQAGGASVPQPSLAQFATGNAVPGGPSSVEGVNPEFSRRINAAVAAMPPEIRAKFQIISGFRDQARQAEVNPGVTDSHHSYGAAVDVGRDPDVLAWINKNGAQYGIGFPLNSDPKEDNHLEPLQANGERIPVGQQTAWAMQRGNTNSFAAGLLNATQREQQIRQSRSDVEQQAVDVGAGYHVKIANAEGGNGALPTATDINNDPMLNDRVRGPLLDRLNAANNKMNTGEKQFVRRAVADDLASMAATGKGVDGLESDRVGRVLGPEAQAEWLDKRQTYQAAYAASVDMPSLTTAEQYQRVQSLQPKSGEPDFAKKQLVYQHAKTAMDKISEQRASDPATAVMTAPNVIAASSAADANPTDPGTVQKAIQASLDEQTRLGIPEANQRAIPNDRAAALVTQLKSAAFGNQDIGQSLDTLGQLYGPQLWPKVFGSMVQQKLPGYFQVLANLDTPEQKPARMDLQHAFAIAEQKGGMEKLKELISPADAKLLNDSIDSQMQPFRNTFVPTAPAGVAFDQIKDATRALAYYRQGLQGQNQSDALASAIKDVTARYDIDGTIRAPKGTIGDVKQAGDATTLTLKPEDVRPIQINGIEGGARVTADVEKRGRELVMDAPKSWYPNEDDSGLNLWATYRDGRVLPVIRADGQGPIGFKFSDVPAIIASHPRPFVPAAPGAGVMP